MEKIVCPFCPLHCDDLQVGADGSISVDCPIACAAFPIALQPPCPRVGNNEVALSEVTEHAGELVSRRSPVVVTSGVTLATAKRLDRLQSNERIDWVIEQTTARASLRRAISRDGMIGATFADVRRHADYIWFIGNRDQRMLPRIDERTTPVTTPMATGATSIHWPRGATARQLGDLLDAVRRDEKPESPRLNDIYNATCDARYLAVVWSDDGFDPIEADAASALLLALILRLNDPAVHENRRAVLLTFDHAQTARSVSLWRHNESLPDHVVDFEDGTTVTIRLGDSNDCSKAVSIQVGGRDPGVELARVYVPAAVEGVHRADAVIRGDGAVTLPLKPFAASKLRTPSEWLEDVLEI